MQCAREQVRFATVADVVVAVVEVGIARDAAHPGRAGRGAVIVRASDLAAATEIWIDRYVDLAAVRGAAVAVAETLHAAVGYQLTISGHALTFGLRRRTVVATGTAVFGGGVEIGLAAVEVA